MTAASSSTGEVPHGGDVDAEMVKPPQPPPEGDLEKRDVEADPEAEASDGAPPSPPQDGNEAWIQSPHNPWNWPTRKKVPQVAMLCSTAILATMGTSIITPAVGQLMDEFQVSREVAILSLTLFVIALAVGPIIGGPLSETVGRYPVYLCAIPAGALFCLGASFCHNIGALLFTRFMAGLCFSPTISVAAGSLADLYSPARRGLPSAVFLLLCFLGPGLGPIVGAFTVVNHGWRWTQRILAIIAVPSFTLTVLSHETFHPKLKRQLAMKGGHGPEPPPKPPLSERVRMFLVVGLVRPLSMMFLDPIIGLICIYVSIEFGILFSFFAAVPYTFRSLHGFTLQQSGLVFVSVIVGSTLGFVTLILCDILLYRKQVPRYPPHKVPPEHRLYAAIMASVGLPVGLFWYAWTAKRDISWASPAVSMVAFSWGNLCLFVSTMQYVSDSYRPDLVASAASANSLARYGFASVFPLFIIQMLESLGIGWGMSVFGFASVALLPFPWLLFKYGPQIRAWSRYAS